MARNDINTWGPIPQGYDLGHAVMPSEARRKGKIFGLLATVGDQLMDIQRSKQKGVRGNFMEIDGSYNMADNLRNIAYRMQDRVNFATNYDRNMMKEIGEYQIDDKGQIVHDGSVVPNVNVSYSQPQMNSSIYQNFSENTPNTNTTMANLNQYLTGGSQNTPIHPVSAPASQTTITFVDLQNANKPIVDKLEITCQLLGKLIGAEMDTQRILAAMPEEIAVQISNVQYGQIEPDESILDEVQEEVDAEAMAASYLPDSARFPDAKEDVAADEVQSQQSEAPRKPRKRQQLKK